MALLIAVFAFGLLRLFVLRFQAGDVHPPYSSLRQDPIGTAVLYESLKQLPDVALRRNFEPLHRMVLDRPATLVYLGASEKWVPAAYDPNLLLDRLEARGGRLVIALFPQHPRKGGCSAKGCRIEAAETSGGKDRRRTSDPKDDSPAGKEKDQPEPATLSRLIEGRCGLRIVADSVTPSNGSGALDQAEGAIDGLPERIAWHGGRHFEVLDPAWSVLYSLNGHPVIVEREYGKNGCIVLAADSYLFSNEALRRHRETALIAHLVGPAGELVFDETHLGLIDQPTIARLIRMHGLHWFLITAGGLVLLAAWQRSAPLAPLGVDGPAADEAPEEAKDSFHGWVSLLRRNIGRGEILGVCIEEWSKAAGQEKLPAPAAVAEMKHAAREIDDPVEGYRRVCEMISERITHE